MWELIQLIEDSKVTFDKIYFELDGTEIELF